MPRGNTEQILANHLRNELNRANSELNPHQWQALLIGVSDDGELAIYPCRLVLPFHYPKTIKELDEYGPDHFEFPESDWKLKWIPVPEFQEQYRSWREIEDEVESHRVGQMHRARRISALQDAAQALDQSRTVFGLESDSEVWWEPITFHISGPKLPKPPPPESDIQLLSRLCRQTGSYIGESRFTFTRGLISEVSFDGADTTDATIDLLRDVPNLRHLLRGLTKLSLRSTMVTSRSLRFLKRELPHVQVDFSYFLDDYAS